MTKDEYQDMAQNYVKILELKLNQNSYRELETYIEHSIFYNVQNARVERIKMTMHFVTPLKASRPLVGFSD